MAIENIIPYPKIDNAEFFSMSFGKDLVRRNDFSPIIDTKSIQVISKFEKALKEKDKEIEELKSHLLQPKVLVIEEIDEPTAEKRVIEYMERHKSADIEELFTNLHIDMEQLLNILSKLGKQGRIRSAKDD